MPRPHDSLNSKSVISSTSVIAFAAMLAISPIASAAPDDEGSDDDRETTDGRDHDNDDDDDRDGKRDRDDDSPDEGDDEVNLRFSIESEVLGGSWSQLDNPAMGVDDDSLSFGFGFGRPSALDDGSVLFTRPVLGMGLGWVFADDRAVLGAKLALTVDGYGIDDDGRRAVVGGRLVPYFHWMFLPDRKVRPYLEARVGFGGAASATDDDMTGRSTTHVIYPMVGGGGGVHFFPRDWFSVDLGLNVDYAAPFGKTTFKDEDQDDTDFDKIGDVVNFGLLLGVSAWFG
jgi:hypothetical protein